MAVEIIEVKIEADDSGLIESFENIDQQTEELTESSKKLESSLDSAFKPRSVQKYGNALDGTTKSLGAQDKQVKKNVVSMSNLNKTGGRGISMLSRFGGVGGRATRSLGGLSFALAGTPFGAFALAGAAATAAYSLFADKLGVNNDEIIKKNNELRQSIGELEADLNQRFQKGKLLAIDLSSLTEAEKQLAKINVISEDLGKTRVELGEAQDKQLKAEFDLQNKIFKTETEKLEAKKAAIEAAKESNILAVQQANQQKAINDLQKAINDLQKEGVDNAKAARAERVKDLKDLNNLFDSLIRDELEKRLLALDKAAEAREEKARELKVSQKEIDRFIVESTKILEEDKAKVRKQFADAEVKARQALFSQLAIDEEKAALQSAQFAKDARDLQIQTLITDETEANELRKQNEAKYQSEIDAITKQFAEKRKAENLTQQQEFFGLQSAALETEISFRNAELENRLELERQAFAGIARSEEEITAFKEQQDKERLNSELNYQIQRLQLVRDFNAEINDAERKALDEQIKVLETRLQGIGTKVQKTAADGAKKGDGLFGLLGISSDTQANVQAVQGALEQATQAVSDAVAERIALYDEEIAAKNKVIEEKQRDLANEIELNKLGKASNIAELQSELAAEKAARDKAESEREEAAKAQFILDTALQSSNLITAISGLYSSLSGLPFGIGVALATALSAVMVGAFISSKASAANAAGFYEGTENVEKALGKNAKSFNGKDAYLGETASGKTFRFDGDERILSPIQNKVLGDMSNDELVANAIIGSSQSDSMPSSKSISNKNKQMLKQQIKNERLKEARIGQATSDNITKVLLDQHGTLKDILKKPTVIPMPDGTTHVITGNTTNIYKKSKN